MTKAICETPFEYEAGKFARCRQCKICRQHYQNTWILRSLMEASTSQGTWAVTFTYRPGEAGADYFLYEDVQRFFKRLRRAGHAFRYVIAGETGSRSTMRVHYHALIFWQTPPPDLPPVIGRSGGGYDRRDWDVWGHGHVVIDQVRDFRTVRYVMKYMAKEDGRPNMIRMSLRPAIGATYIAQEAVKRAISGAPHQYNRFTVEGFKHSLPPMWWKRYQTAVEDTFERLGKRLVIEHESWENSLSTHGQALKKALSEWDVLPTASRARVIHIKQAGLQEQRAMLAATPRGVALYIPPSEQQEDEPWLYNSQHPSCGPQACSDGWADAPIQSPHQRLRSGVYPLEPWQVRLALRGKMPPLTRDQINLEWAYLPTALFKASARRLLEATGQASSRGRRYAIPLSVGKYYGLALAGRP